MPEATRDTRDAAPTQPWTFVCRGGRLGGVVLLLVVALLALGVSASHAQVQIEQVQDVASQIEGATQGQVIVKVAEEGDDVTRGDVLGLVPGGTPALPGVSSSGASAVVVQEGSSNDATVTQEGDDHEASVSQLGAQNDVSVVQGPLSDFGGRVPILPSSAAPGANNLAVSVQNGSENATTIRQYGRGNTAGIRLRGAGNDVSLLQAGQGNGYLLDYAGNGLDLTGPRRVEQIGNQNMLMQEGGAPVSVQMKGNGMRMIIRHNASL